MFNKKIKPMLLKEVDNMYGANSDIYLEIDINPSRI